MDNITTRVSNLSSLSQSSYNIITILLFLSSSYQIITSIQSSLNSFNSDSTLRSSYLSHHSHTHKSIHHFIYSHSLFHLYKSHSLQIHHISLVLSDIYRLELAYFTCIQIYLQIIPFLSLIFPLNINLIHPIHQFPFQYPISS